MNQDTIWLYRVNDDVRDAYMVHCQNFSRMEFQEENNNNSKKIPKLEDPTQHSRFGFIPRRVDLDMDQHVDNVTCVGCVMEDTLHGFVHYPFYYVPLSYGFSMVG